MWRHLRIVFVAWVMGWVVVPVLAQPANTVASVLIVRSDASAAYAEAAQAVEQGLMRRGVSRGGIQNVLASELSTGLKSGSKPATQMVVALGTEATNVLLKSAVNTPVLSVLIPRRSFEGLLQTHGRVASSQLTAIYLDQPLARQLSLIRQALPQAKRLGVLWGPDSMLSSNDLKAMATASGLTLREVRVTTSTAVFAGLREILDDSDVFLALPDPLVFNGGSIQNILLSMFRAYVPMVAFSPAYVRAGALMALYSSPMQAGSQAAELVANALTGKELPDHAIEPNDFEVGVNQHVMRSLGLSLDGSALRLALRRLERLP